MQEDVGYESDEEELAPEVEEESTPAPEDAEGYESDMEVWGSDLKDAERSSSLSRRTTHAPAPTAISKRQTQAL